MLNEIPHVSQKMSCVKVDEIGVGITFGKFQNMRDCLGNADFSQSVQFIVHLEEQLFGNIGAGSRNCLRGYSLAYSCGDSEFGMECGLRFGDVLHYIVDNSESMVFGEQELDVVIAAGHDRK